MSDIEIDDCTKALLNKVLEYLGYEHLTDTADVLYSLYKVLSKNCPEFCQAVTKAVSKSIEKGIQFLETVKDEIIKVCKQHKELTIQLSKLAAKAAAKACIKKSAASCCTKAAIKIGFKTPFKLASPASYVADAAQFGLEVTGHKKIGKSVGLMGNVGAGALGGAAIFGPAGAALGGLFGLGAWIIGEGASQAVDKTL